MRTEREKTAITIKVLDMSGVEAEALKWLKDKGDKHNDVTLVKTRGKYGYIETPLGIFVLDTEGVGSSLPISEENPLEVELYSRSIASDGGKTFSLGAIAVDKMNEQEVRDLPIKEEVNLADFIRQFGHRLESNYRTWKAFLEEVAVKEIA